MPEPHKEFLRGIVVPNWHSYDLSVKEEQVAHLPVDQMLDEDTLHMLRTGLVPDVQEHHEESTRQYLNRLADTVLGTTEVVERITPTAEEVTTWARDEELKAKGAEDAPFWVTMQLSQKKQQPAPQPAPQPVHQQQYGPMPMQQPMYQPPMMGYGMPMQAPVHQQAYGPMPMQQPAYFNPYNGPMNPYH